MTQGQMVENDAYMVEAQEMFEGLTVDQLAALLYSRDTYREQIQTPEAIGSCSAKILGPGGTEVLVTSRGTSIEFAWNNMRDFLVERIKEGFKPVVSGQAYKSEPTVVASTTSHTGSTNATVSVTAGGNTAHYTDVAGEAVQFDCAELEVTQAKGKYYYKIHSVEPRFKQFGVTVWPEVLKSIGLECDDTHPLQHGTDLTGYRATVLMGPSRSDPNKIVAQKVTSLTQTA